MWLCDYGVVVTATSRPHIPRRIITMKKIMSLMLGLSLVMGAITIVSAQDKKEDKKEEGKKKGGKKKADDTKKDDKK
jgi:hypothetical protein